MEEKIKDLIMFLAVIIIASLGYFYYQNYNKPLADNNGSLEQEEVSNITENTKTPPAPIKRTTTASTEEEYPSMTENGTYLVYYFYDGFLPKVLQVRKGSSVRFINKSDNAMRVFTSNDQEFRFAQLNQSQTVGREGTYDFTFTDTGIWEYFNYNAQTHKANILVY